MHKVNITMAAKLQISVIKHLFVTVTNIQEMLSHIYLLFSINKSIAAKSEKHCEIALVCG